MQRLPVVIISILLSICLISGCSSGDRNIREQLDKAESIMEVAPDSALMILDSIQPNTISSAAEKARYALLRSMALDKNYVDNTSFDVLQPAIDYYSKHGSADQKLRTLYYQGRIYQNLGDDELALKTFIRGEELAPLISDSLTLARLYVAQGLLFDKQRMIDSFIKTSLKAGAIYLSLKKPHHQLDCLSAALQGYVIKEKKEKCDSILRIVSFIPTKIRRENTYFLHSSLIYHQTFSSNSVIRMFLDSLNANNVDNDILMDIAACYNCINDPKEALSILRGVDNINSRNQLKYLSIESESLLLNGDYLASVTRFKKYISVADSTYREIYSSNLDTVRERYLLEQKALEESNSKLKIWLYSSLGIGFLMICIAILIIRYRTLKLNKIEIEIDSLKLADAKRQVEEAFKKQKEESEYLKLTINDIEKEKHLIRKELTEQTLYSESIKKLLVNREDILNGLIVTRLTSNSHHSKLFRELEESMKNDKGLFLAAIKNYLSLFHADFLKYIDGLGLSSMENDVIYLYAIGMSGKEIGHYLDTTQHYKVSSEIRRKMNLGSDITSLSSYIKSLLNHNK